MKTATFLLAFSLSAPAFGATRVFVSGTGMDVGSCSITAPCRSFGYALTQTSAGGEIIALNTAGYGTAVITQSVTITAAPGATAFVAASAGIAIDLQTMSTDVVTLRGLALSSTGAMTGINFPAGLLNVENTIVNGFTMYGINLFASGTTTMLQILNSTFRNDRQAVFVYHAAPGVATVTIAGSTFLSNGIGGVVADLNARVAISDSVFAANGLGVWGEASADNAVALVAIDRCRFSDNTFAGIASGQGTGNPRGLVRVANSIVTGNAKGIAVFANDGQVLSRISNGVYTNTVEGNTVDGAFSGTYNAK